MEPLNKEKQGTSIHDEKITVGGVNDEMTSLQAGPDGYYPRSEEEKALSRSVNRKMDLTLLPFLSMLYLFNGLDRSNVGNAQTQGFSTDIGVTDNDVNDAVSLFFVTFVVFQPLSAACGRIFGAKYWIPSLMLIWGALTVGHAFIHGRGQLIAIRLLIGLFEAGFYPTALFYLSTFYTRFDLGVRIGLFYGQYAIAGAFSGAIAYGVFHLKGSLHNWQYLFIIEGALTMFFAVASCLFLPSDPGSAWFLTEPEREFAKERMRLDGERYILENQEADGNQVTNRLNKRDVVETAKDWKLWTVLMSVPPFVCGAVGLYLTTLSSDRRKERGFHIIGGLVVCLVGLIMTVTILNNHGRYVALCILLMGSYVASPLTMAWLSGNTPDPGKRSLVIGVNGFGNLAGAIGSQIFRSTYAPRYLIPFYVTLGIISFSIIGYIAYRMMLKEVNKYRARRLAAWSSAEIEDERSDVQRLGDKKYTFVYGL
ncbi:hypothetical protein N7481_010412 [Penicillium waksmanii]|uniref:uncharacterized protein n=1 Tax=Penicillium waksmanii TaxID=69791 RepID=UPI00254787C5|nr:uncharacterized protein N7481_010412 [Penicillium waksmanii]KAJ5973202.1 hypothetical protein N7481_010412 [Penicillium waksmanii]